MDLVVQALGYFNTHSYGIMQRLPSPSVSINKAELLKKRGDLIGSKCQMFYKDDPFVVTKAAMQYLYDETGCKYLDCISNVQHVGHGNSVVVSAISKQLNESTCNLRFISSRLTECAERILETLPGLDTVLFCNSGSEANDLALRLSRDYTGHYDAVVLEHAYHGHITTTMQMSPYKFDHGCTISQPEWVHVAPSPDVYRGRFRLSDEKLGDQGALKELSKMYSDAMLEVMQKAQESGRSIGAFFAEALQSCGGQVLPPPQYFLNFARHVHNSGGLMVIDEVQTGFGRVGNTFWAHQLYNDGFIPDIVTMGKPMGNGFPVSAVATRREIADALGGKVDYFNTYGGNPVACVAVLAVMDVLKSDNMLQHSRNMGNIFYHELHKLKEKHECIGDVRGIGLFWGIDLVKDRKSREPDRELARSLILKVRHEFGVLLSVDGPFENIIKIKPPLCFNENNVYQCIAAVDSGLRLLEK